MGDPGNSALTTLRCHGMALYGSSNDMQEHFDFEFMNLLKYIRIVQQDPTLAIKVMFNDTSSA
jgi:hypothetical protein